MSSKIILIIVALVGVFTFCNSQEVSKGKFYKVKINTNKGNFVVTLRHDVAPKTVKNFVKLVKKGFYDGLIFHRIIEGFVVQGGDPEGTGKGGPGYTLPPEINTDKLPHKKGVLSMARKPDKVNPERRSSGSQFYICLGRLTQLDEKYTTFGKVSKGMEVVEKIGKVETNSGNKPVKDVVMKDLKIIQSPKKEIKADKKE